MKGADFRLVALIALVTSAVGIPDECLGLHYLIERIPVAQHEGLQGLYTTYAVDAYLLDVENRIKTNSGDEPPCADYPCCMYMQRQGDIGSFPDPDDETSYLDIDAIQTAEDMLNRVPYEFMIVRSMNFPGIGPVLGVAFQGHEKAAVVATASTSVWAHELGHCAGAGEAQDDCTNRIMHSPETGDQYALTVSECTLFYMKSDDDSNVDCSITPVGPTFAAAGGNSQITLTWEEFAPGPGVFYDLYRSDSCWGPLELVAQISGGDPLYTPDGAHYTYADTGADYVRQYYYELHTWDGYLVTATATPTGGLTPSLVGAPHNLTGFAVGDGDSVGVAHLSWQSGGGVATGYHVYRSEYASMPTCEASYRYLGVATSTTFIDNTAPCAGFPIFYRVRAFNSSGGSFVSNELQITSFPHTTLSYFVPQRGSVTTPIEGSLAVAFLRTCPNNDGGTSLPNNVRVKVTLRGKDGQGIAGVPASSVYIKFNGGSPQQGFSGDGADSVIANSQYNPQEGCPDVRTVFADAPTNAAGTTYITFAGASPDSPGVAIRNPNRKWGHYDTEIPVYLNGYKLQGRLTTPDTNGSYVLRIKNCDLTGGLGTALNLGEMVTSADFSSVANNIGDIGPLSYWRDLDSSGEVTGADFSIISQHPSHDCNSPLSP